MVSRRLTIKRFALVLVWYSFYVKIKEEEGASRMGSLLRIEEAFGNQKKVFLIFNIEDFVVRFM